MTADQQPQRTGRLRPRGLPLALLLTLSLTAPLARAVIVDIEAVWELGPLDGTTTFGEMEVTRFTGIGSELLTADPMVGTGTITAFRLDAGPVVFTLADFVAGDPELFFQDGRLTVVQANANVMGHSFVEFVYFPPGEDDPSFPNVTFSIRPATSVSEPGTTLGVLAGALALLTSRRRRPLPMP